MKKQIQKERNWIDFNQNGKTIRNILNKIEKVNINDYFKH